MGRPQRLQLPGACYYVLLEGNNRQDLFLSSQDRRQFLALLRSCKERHELKVYAYCLLPQKVHLLVETDRPNLAAAMQNLGSVYTKRFNAAHDVSGHLFAGRYKAWLLDKERFLAEATRAIHLQPSRSGLRDKPWRYPWSSCSAYVESEAGEPLIDSQPVLALFASGRLKQSVRYMQYLKDRLKSSSAVLLPVARGQVIGGEEFLARMRARAGRVEPARPSPEAERQVLAEVAKRHGLEPEELTGPGRRRRVAAARREAAYRLSKELRLGVAELGRLFHRTPSALCQALRTAEISTKKLNS